MAYVSVPKDLTKGKNKVAFNLTKRQLICIPDMKKLTELMAKSEMLMLYGTLLLLMTMHIRIIWMRLF